MTVELFAIDSADAWTTATITADDGGGAHTFTAGADVRNGLQWVSAFLDFLFVQFGDVAAWEYNAHDDRSVRIDITGSQTYTWTASSAAQSLLDMDAGDTSDQWELRDVSTAWSQTRHPLSFGAYRRAVTWEAVRAGTGAAGGSSLAAGVRRPVLAGLTEARGAWRLAELSRRARHPRSITVWDGLSFLDLSLGLATRQRSAPGVYRIEFEVLA